MANIFSNPTFNVHLDFFCKGIVKAKIDNCLRFLITKRTYWIARSLSQRQFISH